MPRAPRARGHLHVPFYEGTCQNLLHLLMNNSGATPKWNYDGFRYPNRLKFYCVTPCVSPLRGGQHAMCPACTWARARVVLWRHVPKLALRNFSNSRATSKSNYYGYRTPNWLKFFFCGTVCALGASGRVGGGLHGELCHEQDGVQGDERADHILWKTTKMGMDMKTKVNP